MSKALSFILISVLHLVYFSPHLHAQQLKLGLNPTKINRAAVLELQSGNQGLLLTRVDTNNVNAIIGTLQPSEQDSTDGMIIYQVKDSSIYYRAGGFWHKLITKKEIQKTSSTRIRSLNEPYKISDSQDVYVSYSIHMVVSPVLLGDPGRASASLQISPTGSAGPWTTISQVALGNDLVVGGLVSLGGSISSTQILSGWIPKGAYIKISTSKNGTASISCLNGQEVSM